MKKVLLASSALVGVAALTATPAAAQLEVSLGGFTQFHASAGDADVHDNDRSGGFAMNNEIYVNGSATADNGLEYGFQVQMEAAANETNNVDEAQVFLEGGWGKVVLGNEDGAEDLAMVNGSYVGVGYGGVGNPTSTFLTNISVGSAVTSVDISDSGDGSKVTYWTPTFGGFQAGVSYSPDSTVGNSGTEPGSDPSGTAGAGFHDYIGLGANYSGEFNGFGIDIGAVYGMADVDESPQVGDPDNELSAWGAGIQLSFMGFTAATGYEDTDLDDGGEHSAWDYGIGYETGPWTIAAAGIMSEGNGGAGDADDEWDAWSLTLGYQLAPGLALNLTGLTGTAEIDGDDNDVSAVTTSVLVSF